MKRIKERIKERTKKSTSKLIIETKKALNTAMLTAFGFLMALVWRDVITEFVNEVAQKSPLQGKIISALIITFICVIGILIVVRITKIEEKIIIK